MPGAEGLVGHTPHLLRIGGEVGIQPEIIESGRPCPYFFCLAVIRMHHGLDGVAYQYFYCLLGNTCL